MPDMGKLADSYAASEEHAGRKMHVVADHAIMLDNGGCVHNAVLPDLSARVDHDFRHDDGAGLNSGRLGNHRRRVDESHGQEKVFEGSVKACGPHFIVPNGHRIFGTTFGLQELQVPARFEQLAGAELLARSVARIVDE